MPYSPGYDADAVHEREQELLLRIVQRTAENLIDISNSHSIERLQQQDAIDPMDEINEAIEHIEIDYVGDLVVPLT
ncbi:1719_t:CDS:2 [Diversispora eburnea]|uniref:1719_t:CDS:1 n=1 Tax=Diversispora eburnea TaxID=1213867 RepID=A0A9N8VAX0_9GLOM|nr:1719_t:CDS:2 [Diversispora eburnea]